MNENFETRVKEARKKANQAFWAVLPEAFPEAKTGDFPPDAHFEWEEAVRAAIDVWVDINVRGEYDGPICASCSRPIFQGQNAVMVSRGSIEDGAFRVQNVGSDGLYHGGCWAEIMEHTISNKTSEEEDTEALRQQQEATGQLRDLIQQLGIEMAWTVNDWKRVTEHYQEISEFIHSHPGWYFHSFPACYSFKDGSGDDLIAIFTSGLIDHEDGEKIANLIYNLGAEWGS